jgi:hypothetical protein
MLQVRRHVDPRSCLSFLHVFAESDSCLSLHEEQRGWFRRRVFGEFLPLAEPEDHRLDAVVLVDRAAEDAVSGWLGFVGEVEDVGVGGDFIPLGSTKRYRILALPFRLDNPGQTPLPNLAILGMAVEAFSSGKVWATIWTLLSMACAI